MRVFRFIVLVAAMVGAATPVASGGGGTLMDTPDQHVEPGEYVEFVGYVGADNADGGPWYAFLDTDETVLALGPLTIETTGLGGYLSHRVYLAFTVPSTLTTGTFVISVQNGTAFNNYQTEYLGDLIGATVEVGTFRSRSYYPWPLDEPLVAALPADAVMAGPDWEITAGEVHQGIYPKCQWGCLLDPTLLQREDVTIVDRPPSWVTTTTTPATTTSASTTTTTMSMAGLVGPGTTTTDPRTTEVSQDGANDVALMTAGIMLAIAVSFIAADRSRETRASSVPEPRVQEDDVTEPINV